VSLLGKAVGAGLGALAGSLADVGIGDEFNWVTHEQMTPETSARLLMTYCRDGLNLRQRERIT
jgi:uncharacterized membrane protein